VLVAHCYLEHLSWDLVRSSVKTKNLLQTRTVRSNEILIAELIRRLSLLSHDQIETLAEGQQENVTQLVWIALCKQYAFIADFTLEVLAPAYSGGRHLIDYDDYRYFFNSKADWHPELEKISDKTCSNARQALFQMMRQCQLLTETNQLMTQMISAALQNCTPESELVYIPGAIRL
jgi:hypothetical protein